MRVIIAARLSKLVAGKAQTGIESSDAALVDWAAREGHEIVHIAADFKSGTSDPWDRPNLRPWVTDPNKIASYDAVVAYRLDRLSRGDKRSTSRIEEWAYANGKQLLTEDGLQFPCEGAAGIQWDVTSRIAHEEWLKTSERYSRMAKHLRSNGFHVGRAPFGFASIVKPGQTHKTLVQVPAEADIVRDAVEWYLGGTSLDNICAKLNDSGRLPRPMKNGHQPKWAASTISKVLHNEVIAGRQTDGSGKTIARVEPIVSREIWTSLIGRLAERSKRKGVSQTNAPALLTSIIRCMECDKSMYRTGPNYYCHTKGCQSIIRIEVADADVHAAMSGDNRRDIIETLVKGSGYDAEIAEVKRDLAEAVETEEFERIPALRAELDRLRSLPASATRVERRESSQTVAEMWAAMPDDTARRAYLMERGARALYSNEAGRILFVLGQSQSL